MKGKTQGYICKGGITNESLPPSLLLLDTHCQGSKFIHLPSSLSLIPIDPHNQKGWNAHLQVQSCFRLGQISPLLPKLLFWYSQIIFSPSGMLSWHFSAYPNILSSYFQAPHKFDLPSESFLNELSPEVLVEFYPLFYFTSSAIL